MKKQIVLLLLIYSTAVQAQKLSPQVVASGGAYLQSTELSLSYTIGEIAVETLTGSSLTLTQGFQQPLEIGGTFSPETMYPDWQVKTWPNPVVKELFLQLGPDIQKDFILETYDLTGKLHLTRKIEAPLNSEPYSLDLSNLKQGIYILNIQAVDHSIKRIVKIQKH